MFKTLLMNKPKLSLGIFGAGQLAQMLIENSPYSDLEISAFTEDLECPAKYATNSQLFKGSINDAESLRRFFSRNQFLTFENEFVDIDAIAKIKTEFPRVYILPTIPTMEVTQNKLAQKFLFQKLNLPTARFKAFDPQIDELPTWTRSLMIEPFEKSNRPSQNSFMAGFVIKKAFGGYDGKGNFVCKTLGDLERSQSFCEKALADGSTIYAEELIPFKKELAQIYTRSMNGDFVCYPLVISEQEESVCRLVYGPATEFEVPKEIEAKASQIGKKIAEELNFVGTFAIEYFYYNDSLLINEMAPRVHNSGHYTLDAAPVNQFENHIHAILGAKLKQPSTYPFFAMRNILGPKTLPKQNTDKITFANKVFEKFKKTEDVKVYWYHKKETSKYRKLGHINAISMTKIDILRKIKIMEEIETEFWNNI